MAVWFLGCCKGIGALDGLDLSIPDRGAHVVLCQAGEVGVFASALKRVAVGCQLLSSWLAVRGLQLPLLHEAWSPWAHCD